jgi:predicted DNA-binding protein
MSPPRRCHAADPRDPHTVDQIARTRTEEVRTMSIPDNGSTKAGVKTLAIRLEPDLHAQLSLIAQLRGSTITDEIRTAIEAHITAAKTTPELAAQSQAVLDDIERDAMARREAIATLFDIPTDQPSDDRIRTDRDATASSRARGRKQAGTEVPTDS